MKNLIMVIFLCLFLISFTTSVIAEQKVSQVDQGLNENGSVNGWTGYNVRAGGGPEIGWLRLDLDNLNNILASNDFPELNNNFFIYGSSGVAGRKIGNRLGGLNMKGYGERKEGDKLTRFSINYSGLVYKKGFYANNDLEISAGAMLGTGGIELRLLSDDLDDFESIIGDIAEGRHYTTTMEKSFLAFNPKISLAYSLIGPVDISVSGGYLFTHDLNSDWEIAGSKVAGGPLSNFKGFNLTFQLFIGF